MYATDLQLTNFIGEVELASLTDRDSSVGGINYTVLNEVKQSAEKLIDSYLMPAYNLPLADDVIANSPLPESTVAIIHYMLYRNVAPDEVRSRYKDAISWLKDVRAKRATLGSNDVTAPTVGKVVITQGASGTSWDSY